MGIAKGEMELDADGDGDVELMPLLKLDVADEESACAGRTSPSCSALLGLSPGANAAFACAMPTPRGPVP